MTIEPGALTAIRHVVAAVLKADGKVATAEPDAGVEVMARFGADGYTLDDLEDDLVALSRVDLSAELQAIADDLSVADKEAVVSAAAYLSTCDDDVDRWELDVAREVGEALGLSADHTTSTIDRELATHRPQAER